MSDRSAILVWLRRDLRLADNPVLDAAARSGRPVIPVFIADQVFEGYGICPRWRHALGAAHFATVLAAAGSRLILRRGPALEVLRALIEETRAGAVWWGRAYDPEAVARDTEVKSALRAMDVDAQSFAGHLLFEPWTVAPKTGPYFKVYTPFWNAVRQRGVATPLGPAGPLRPPDGWPPSDPPPGDAARAMDRGAAIVAPHLNIGEARAEARLAAFAGDRIAGYRARRDFPADPATSKLSENLAWGEISARRCWQAGMRALEEGKAGAETFLKELVWREFAYHLAYHTPRIVETNWRPRWDAFPWNEDGASAAAMAWKTGRTGIELVDAAMREMYVTGHMHNRARMIVASYLTKHLLHHWRIGQGWFADHLADWDPASNAMGWQWVAGSGPDAAPYFRIFNPDGQRAKFDPDRAYVDRWIAEGRARPSGDALAYFDAVPRHWGLAADDPYPAPVEALDAGRRRALAAYQARGM